MGEHKKLVMLPSDPASDARRVKYFPFGFTMSREAVDAYGVAELVRPGGPMEAHRRIAAVRQLADRMTARRRPHETARKTTVEAAKGSTGAEGSGATHSEEPVRTGQLLAMGWLKEAFRCVIMRYCTEQRPGSLSRGMAWARTRRGQQAVDESVHTFVRLYPPQEVLAGITTEAGFLGDSAAMEVKGEAIVTETIILFLAMDNPALAAFRDLFDDAELRRRAAYEAVVRDLEEFFRNEPSVVPLGQQLFECLRAPVRASSDSLAGQIEYIKRHWAALLPSELLAQLVFVEDVTKEELQERFLGPGPIEVADFRKHLRDTGDDRYPEPERFSADADWMSNVVMIAKSVHVWLDQLSKRYERAIRRLDEIPDEELDRLARWGFSALWLIGLWERAPASKRIKRLLGNAEAESSAYSVYDYVVADNLGGEAALRNLRVRALQRGIRLASDMVPNHMGLDSKWVVEHPEWFVQTPEPPFPWYRFTGPDLSSDPRVGLFIEDGYWDRRDAAVVFKRVDRTTGAVAYIYHGNDGTAMPWNDTAQLNYLMPEVREAVIQTILHVARLFPIIRFDAAMTLAKRHYQRLWHPKPGEGGAIPSRAEHGMSRAEFDAHMPEEFWREVVERVAKEAPDTLLLAEAFWLMEGYFVRTLGMHRVYNSAFMNMLKMQENAKYRDTVKNVLEFSPEVLKRFVNFLNNPDELTAIEQFGDGDKYMGCTALMVTMPGLPMFGHGQIEGFREKYGMEYQRAYWDEPVNEALVRRHEREVFPLMWRRRLFSGVEHFALYDLVTPDGRVNENVFAFSNRFGDHRAIVVYNNAMESTSGWIYTSAAMNVGPADDPVFIRKTLGEALHLRAHPRWFYVVREHWSGLQFLRAGWELAEKGLFVMLRGYQCQAFLEFREIHDLDGSWARLHERLAGAGVSDMDKAHEDLRWTPLADAFGKAVRGDLLRSLSQVRKDDKRGKAVLERFEMSMRAFLRALAEVMAQPVDQEAVLRAIEEDLDTVNALETHAAAAGVADNVLAWVRSIISAGPDEALSRRLLLGWAVVRSLNRASTLTEPGEVHWLDEWRLAPSLTDGFKTMGRNRHDAELDTMLVKILVRYEPILAATFHGAPPTVAGATSGMTGLLRTMSDDPLVGEYLRFNRYDGVLWLNKEQFEALVQWLFVASLASGLTDPRHTRRTFAEAVTSLFEECRRLLAAVHEAGYRVEHLLDLLARK